MEGIFAIAINVPGSLLKPGILRRTALEEVFKVAFPEVQLNFLQNPCTCEEIADSDALKQLAKRHDTFINPMLCKKFIGVPFIDELTPKQKATAKTEIMDIISRNWEVFLAVLQKINFQPMSVPEEDHFFYSQNMIMLLDSTRTMLTRTACTISHQRAYEQLAKANTQKKSVGLILEDDLVMLPKFPSQIESILEWLRENDPDWDMVQLGYSKHQERPIEPIKGSPLARAPLGAYGNTAVLVNLLNGAASRIATVLEKHRYDVIRGRTTMLANDVVLAQTPTSFLNRYVAAERFVGPPLGDHISVIAGKTMNYDSCCWDYEQLEELKTMANSH